MAQFVENSIYLVICLDPYLFVYFISLSYFCLLLCQGIFAIGPCLTLADYCTTNRATFAVIPFTFRDFTSTMYHFTYLIKGVFCTWGDWLEYEDGPIYNGMRFISIFCWTYIWGDSSHSGFPVCYLVMSAFNVFPPQLHLLVESR